MSNELVQESSDQNFQTDVLDSSQLTLVDFWAEWCAPCKAIAPVIDELATAYDGKVAFKKVNIDSNPQTPTQFGVRGIPTLILFKDGQAVDQIVGVMPKEKIQEFIDKHMA